LTWINDQKINLDTLASQANERRSGMRHLSMEQRESLDRMLQERSGVLIAEISAALRQQDTPESIHLANRFEETGEAAIAGLELALEIASIERDAVELRGVLAARSRINTLEFGVCVDCGAEIPYARLLAEPSARRCIDCQRAVEHAGTGTPHPSL
jgi:DnaK suppressor protein